jgi:hypothetical protein
LTSRHPLTRAAHRALFAGFLFVGLSHSAQAHDGGLGNEIMWTACEARKINDRCAFENLHQDVYRGTCQSMSNALVCVRNQPIEYAVGAAHALDHEHPVEATGDESPRAPVEKTGRSWPWLLGYGLLLAGLLTTFNLKRQQKT